MSTPRAFSISSNNSKITTDGYTTAKFVICFLITGKEFLGLCPSATAVTLKDISCTCTTAPRFFSTSSNDSNITTDGYTIAKVVRCLFITSKEFLGLCPSATAIRFKDISCTCITAPRVFCISSNDSNITTDGYTPTQVVTCLCITGLKF